MFLSLRAGAHTGVAIRSPLFTFASGGHLSFNSERKVRKNATKTYGFGFPQRAAPCRKFVSYFLAQSPFPCAVVRQKDCATTAFRCRFADAACCHGRSFYLYRRTGVLPIPTQLTSLELPFRASAHTGVGIRSPVPAPAGASPLFIFASGGHLSFNSERKVRKNATKTYGFGFPQRAAPCREFASCFSRNRFSRVPLSVKRTVPPQLSAVALLPLPVATVGVSPSTAVTGREL